jgi:mycothiol synthase
MGITTRDLSPEDAESIAALMVRIEVDHPTGFCLGAVEIREIMNGHGEAVFEGAFDGQDLVAYTTVMASEPGEEGQKLFLFGDVDPGRLGEGLGTLMLTRSIDRGRAMHAEAAPGAPARFAATALAGRPDQAELMVAAGLRPGRHGFLMVADLRERLVSAPLPDDVTVGPFDPEAAEELRQAHVTAFADYPDFSGMSQEFWEMFMVTAAHARHGLSAVARDSDGAVAAYVHTHEYAVPPSGGPGPELHVPYVGTVPGQRGRGLATGLLSRVLHGAREAGYPTASLNVDTENPTGALGIYERAGFRQSYRQDFFHLDE